MLSICFLCASDEGIFLDISEDKSFFNKIEVCLSLKASKDDALSTKICHKCAYEVDKCYDFVHKYKESRKRLETHLKRHRKTNCNFCQEPGKKGYFFNLKKTNKINDAFHKIYYLFEELSNETDIFICLVCRYSIDLLFDLKSISEEVSGKLHQIIDEGVEVSLLPKTRTTIVRRKTTRTKSPRIDLHTPSDTESDSSTMARGSGKVSGDKANKKSKNRFCDQCQTETEKGVDMFRIHRTGRTVCKDCWIRMDPEKETGKNKRKRNLNDTDTKSCKIFLKDILTNEKVKGPKPYKAKSGDGKAVYTVTDDSSSSESRSSTKTKAQLKELPEIEQPARPVSKRTSKVSETVEISDESGQDTDGKRNTRRGEKVLKVDSVVDKPKRVEKEKPVVKEKPLVKEKPVIKEKPVVKEKPMVKEKPKFEKPVRAQKKLEKATKVEKAASTSRKRANGNQSSDSEVRLTKRSRSSSIESVASGTITTRPKRSGRKARIRGDSESTVFSEDLSQPEDVPKKRLRNQSDSAVSVSPTSNSKRAPRGKKTSPISSKESSPVVEFKTPPTVSKPSVAKRGRGRPTKKQVEERTFFTCAACGTDFSESKEYKQHQELHLKNLEIKLQRIAEEEKKDESERLPSIQEEAEQDEDVTSSKIEKRLEENDNAGENLGDKTESVDKTVMEDKTESVQEDKTELVQKDILESVQDKTESVQDEPELVQDEPESGQDKLESVQDKTESVQDKTESVQDKTESIQDKTESVQDKTESVLQDKTEFLKDKSELVTEDNKESIQEENKSELVGEDNKESTPEEDKFELITEDSKESTQEEQTLEDKSQGGKATEEKSQDDSQSQDEDRENLEDLLQREELQVIDEVAESVSSAVDPDEELEKEVLDKNESVEDESQEDFTVVYTGSSQESITDALTLNSEALEEPEKLDENSGNMKEESLKKEKPAEKDRTLQTEERKELDESEKKAHSTPTNEQMEDQNQEIEDKEMEDKVEDNQEMEGDKAIDNMIKEGQGELEITENQLETIEDMSETNKLIPETVDVPEMNPIITEGNLEEESLLQETADVVQNGLEQVDIQENFNSEIIGENELESSKIENEPESKAEVTVTEVLQEVFDLATSKVQQREETEKITTVSFSQENLEEVSNDALNGGDMPSLETDESEISNL